MLIIRFKEMLKSRTEPQGQDRWHRSLELAAAALMLEVARADYVDDPKEERAALDLLATTFDLAAEDRRALLDRAAEEADAATCLHQFVAVINETASPEDKRSIINCLWQVAYADGNLDKYEEHLIRRVADLIYLPHQEFIQLKLANTPR